MSSGFEDVVPLYFTGCGVGVFMTQATQHTGERKEVEGVGGEGGGGSYGSGERRQQRSNRKVLYLVRVSQFSKVHFRQRPPDELRSIIISTVAT